MVLSLTEANPGDRPNAEEALEHRWMYSTEVANEKTTRESALNLIKSPYISPYKTGISRELMSRVHNKSVPTQMPYSNLHIKDTHNTRTRNPTDISSANGLLASLRIADHVIGPKVDQISIPINLKDDVSTNTSISEKKSLYRNLENYS